MTNIDTKLMQMYKTAGERRDMIRDGSEYRWPGNNKTASESEDKFLFNGERLNVYAVEIWNAAIEAAIAELKVINDLGGIFLVGKLKK